MSNSEQIKYAVRNDIYDIAVFLNNCWKAVYRGIIEDDFLDAMSVEQRYMGLLTRYDDRTQDFLIMQKNGKLIGAAVFGQSFTEGYETDGEISAIYFHKDYIGKGHGHRLFLEVEKALNLKGYAHFIVDVLEGNAQALEFYLIHGYEKVADRTVLLGEIEYPLIVLRKSAA